MYNSFNDSIYDAPSIQFVLYRNDLMVNTDLQYLLAEDGQFRHQIEKLFLAESSKNVMCDTEQTS